MKGGADFEDAVVSESESAGEVWSELPCGVWGANAEHLEFAGDEFGFCEFAGEEGAEFGAAAEDYAIEVVVTAI